MATIIRSINRGTLTSTGQLTFTDSAGATRGQIVSVSGDLWILSNARWDVSTEEFYRIDNTKAAFGWQLQGQGFIPGEPDLGFYVAGATLWVAQPESYSLIRNGGVASNPRFAGIGGWELGHVLTQERQFTVGGMGIELDGSGTFPYGRVVHSTTGTIYARRLTGGMHNVYPDLGGRDDPAKPGWFWGWSEQYNPADMTTVAGSRKWQISYLPNGTTQWLTRFSVDEFGTVSGDNLHADTALCVGYPGVGGGQTVLGIQNANTAPTSNPTNGGVLYAQGGELKWKASSGTTSTLTPTTPITVDGAPAASLDISSAAVTASDVGAVPATGGTITGNLSIQDATPTKRYRFTTSGSGVPLYLEVGGENLVLRTNSQADFSGTSREYVRMSKDAQELQLAGEVQFRTSIGGTTVHDIDSSTGVAAVGAKNGLTNLRFCGYKSTTGAPTSGTWATGDLVMDSAKVWWRCSSGGTPGTWA